MKKRLMALFLSFAATIALAACGDEETKPGTPSASGGSVQSSALVNDTSSSENSVDGSGGEASDGKNDTENSSPLESSVLETVEYRIFWVDKDGKTIAEEKVQAGDAPVGCTYTVQDTAEWDYTFLGWALAADGDVLSGIPTASADTTYYARVSAVKQTYTVVFHGNGGSEVEAQTIAYGENAVEPIAPIRSGYKFTGWSVDEAGQQSADFTIAITGNTDFYANWNQVVDVKALLSTLLAGYELNPFERIPESMRMDYSANLVAADSLTLDYGDFVNISDIRYGFGEQWQMVLDNLEQSKTFFNVLSVLEGLSTTSVAAFNDYFDKNPADTAHYNFLSGGVYGVTIDFDGETIAYVLDYTATLPVFGEQAVQIALCMNAMSGEKTVRIQIGDANALTYKLLDYSYEFAIKYMGVRRAMFSVEWQENGNVSGKIYEHLTISSVETASAAEFYIADSRLSVVGNKASGLLGFSGYICELYDTAQGRLLGYEVEETDSVIGKIKYDTLWFNLSDVDGITSIKYLEESDTQKETEKYINGMTAQWQAKKVGGIGATMASRRFDISFRTQYIYSYNAETEAYTAHAVQVPMLHVQEGYFDSLQEDVKATNGVDISVTLAADDFELLCAEYDEKLPVFIEHKDAVSGEYIVAYIGNKKEF